MVATNVAVCMLFLCFSVPCNHHITRLLFYMYVCLELVGISTCDKYTSLLCDILHDYWHAGHLHKRIQLHCVIYALYFLNYVSVNLLYFYWRIPALYSSFVYFFILKTGKTPVKKSIFVLPKNNSKVIRNRKYKLFDSAL